MIDINSPKPLYEQIQDYVLHQISSGAWEHNTRIPSERDLSDEFDVSRATVGKAIEGLVRAGHLNVQIGKGTYVSEPLMKQQIDTLTSFTEEMELRGQKTTSQVLSASVKVASPDIVDALNIQSGDKIVELKRLRCVSNHPMAIEHASLVASMCPNILSKHNFAQESLYAVLRKDYGVNLISAEQTFEARAATCDESRLLGLKEGAPVLAINRVTYDNFDRACEEVKSVYRGDRYKFRAKLSRI